MPKTLQEAKYNWDMACQFLLNAQSAKESLDQAQACADRAWRNAIEYFDQTKAEYKALQEQNT